MKKNKYRVRSGYGKHTTEDRKRFAPGQVFESTRDLVAQDPKKFERVSDTAEPDTPLTDGKDVDRLVNGETDSATSEADVGTDAGTGGEGGGEDDNADAIITLKAVNISGKPGEWDVVKVVDGEVTDEAVNEEFMNKKNADKMAKAGIDALEE